MRLTIRALTNADRDDAVRVINAAAAWYAEFLPPEEVSGPEMIPDEWSAESERMTWYGAYEDDELVGVVGLERAGDVALLRHWYVDPSRQRRGVGSRLREHLEGEAAGVGRMIAGTYADNHKARGALERAGYELSADSEAVLRAYYDIPEDRLVSSVTYERRL